MWKNLNFDRCLSYINSQEYSKIAGPPIPRPSITISRMCGAGGRTVASLLAEYLQTHARGGYPWTVFDRNLIEKVLEDHHLSKRVAEFVPEAHKSLWVDTLEDILGLHPPMETIVRQTAETIWNLAERGNVIIIGRAANVVTAKLKNMFNVRLIGSLQNRIAQVEKVYDFDRRAAEDYIKLMDDSKRRYLKEYYGKSIDDPELYHLVINTDHISYEDAAKLIGDAVIRQFKLEPLEAAKARA